VVYITRDYMEVYQGDEDGIAYVLGHELGHHFLGHILYKQEYKTQTKADIDQRRKEADADMFGAKLLLRADFSLKLAIKSNFDAMKHKKATYSSAQGSWCDHPSQVRRQMAVKLANGKIVHVGESVKDVKDKLGTPASEMPDSSTGLNILSYPALGVTFITDTQEVVGLTLTGENSPVILVQEKGTNGKVLGEVRIGMTRDEVKTQTGVTDWISRKFTNISDERCYPYSPGLGIALIYGKGKNANVVVGILIGSIKAQGEEVVQR